VGAEYLGCSFSFAGPLFCFPAGPESFFLLTQDFVRAGVLDFVLGCFLSPLWGWGLVGLASR
jgi:hypothetical protein